VSAPGTGQRAGDYRLVKLESENAGLRRELRNVWEANRHLTDLLAGRAEVTHPGNAPGAGTPDPGVVAELVEAVRTYKPVAP
jgi:hypothetical protein